jgi:uncharacterized protein YcbX
MQTDASPALPGQVQAGSVVALWRYPVKSMLGEELNCSDVTSRGLLGDRQFAVVDRSTGKVGGAKNPRKWGNFFDFRAAIGGNVRLAITQPCSRCVMITLPQGDLPKDSGILRTAAQHNAVNVGVYASVLSGGTIHRGDPVTLT